MRQPEILSADGGTPAPHRAALSVFRPLRGVSGIEQFPDERATRPAAFDMIGLDMSLSASRSAVLDALAAGTRGRPGLDLLVLFGSRARGAARPGADWDFGYLAAPETDVPALLAALVDVLRDDRVDLVDLGRAGGLLRYRAACDGRLVHEASAGRFDGYRLEAARFWCENAPIFEAGYDEVLKSLRP